MRTNASKVCYNARIKVFPNGVREVLVCDKPIFKEDGWERSGWRKASNRTRDSPGESPEDSPSNGPSLRAMRRARAQVRELALCNDFSLFVTLTLDRERVNRYDMAEITGKLNVWLDNNVRRRGLRYVLVPERHKDGAVHFHGFFNDALPVVDSGHTDSAGHQVFNLPRWGFGFSTAIGLYGEYDRAVSYVCKYIGKQGEKIGGRWFYSGGDLQRPAVEFADLDMREIMEMPGAYCFDIPEAGCSFAGVRIKEESE